MAAFCEPWGICHLSGARTAPSLLTATTSHPKKARQVSTSPHDHLPRVALSFGECLGHTPRAAAHLQVQSKIPLKEGADQRGPVSVWLHRVHARAGAVPGWLQHLHKPPNATQGSPLCPARWEQPDLQGVTSLVAGLGCCWCRAPAGCVTPCEPAGHPRTGQTAAQLIKNNNEIHTLCYGLIQRGSITLSYTSSRQESVINFSGFPPLRKVLVNLSGHYLKGHALPEQPLCHSHISCKGAVEEIGAANTTGGMKEEPIHISCQPGDIHDRISFLLPSSSSELTGPS